MRLQPIGKRALHGTSPGKFRISNRGLLTCWLKEAARGLLAEGRRWFYFSGWRCGSQGKVRWESTPPWSCVSHAVAASAAGNFSFSRQGKPGCCCKPISISLSAPSAGLTAPHPRRAPWVLPETRSREGVSWPQLSSGAALSPVPAAIPWLQTPLDHSCWDGLSAQSQRKGDSHAMLGSREIRNKPKPSRKRGLCLCISQKELGGLGSPSSWLITASQIFN